MRREPRHFLAVNARLVVNALDGDEHFAQAVRLGDVGLKLQRQRARSVDNSGGYTVALVRGEKGEEVNEGERVVEVANGVHERGVALLDEVVEAVLGLAFLETVGGVMRLLRLGLFDLALVRA